MQKRILITNFAIRDYTGSEIDSLDIANYFLKQDYKVDIFTLNFNEPLKSRVNKEISVYTYDDTDKLSTHYDLIWAHHFPLLDYLLFNKKITATYINFVSLSSYEPLEFPPVYYKELSNICLLSNEAKNIYEEKIDIKDSIIFPNYIPNEFLNSKPREIKKLDKICIISNHIPDELEKCAEIFNKEGIETDIYGMGHKWEKITPEILKKYDLVITIGKSVLYSLYLKIPCFIYDHFGGDLFVNKNNISNSYDFNFSGRACKIKLNAEEIYKYIKENFEKSLDSIQDNYEFVVENCLLETNMKKVLKKVYEKKVNFETLFEKYGYLSNYTEPYVRDVFYRNNMHQIELSNNIKNLEKISRLTEQISTLSKERDEFYTQMVNMNKEITKIVNSKSWYITKPFRGVYRLFSKKNQNDNRE